jgi:hypothetical protein
MSEFSGYDLYQATGAAVETPTSEIARKTQKDQVKTPGIPQVTVSRESNPLNKFRTFNYIFTLACIDSASLKDPELLRKKSDYYIIARSGGKGDSKILRPDSASETGIKRNNIETHDQYNYLDKNRLLNESVSTNQQIVDAFNNVSSGRYDFFINNVEIETLMSGDNKTNMAMATKMSFDIYEPYSINGFIETLQVAAIAAGHSGYVSAPFLLKVEFIGYTDDSGDFGNIVRLGNQGTRYFVFTFTGMEITATESGTRYSCKAVPHNEIAYGDANLLKTNSKITGNTVGEILQDFMTQVTKSKEEESKKIREAGKPALHDKYEIVFPSVGPDGLDFTVANKKIMDSDVTDLLTTANNYKFAEQAGDDAKSVKYSSKKTVVHFADGQNIHDCIIAIIRDSDYTKNLLKKLNENTAAVPDDGLVDYFSIQVERTPQGSWDDVTKREMYNYRFVVIPYKIHYTRIPMFENKTVNDKPLKLLARREYNYIYTGKNVDVKTFNLKFNHLYFQAIQTGLANNPIFSASSGIQPKSESNVILTGESKESTQKRISPTTAVMSSVQQGTLTPPHGSGGRQSLSDPYDALVKGLHQAILDNLSMVTADLGIYGDPYFLVTGGIGNYNPKIKTYGETQNGEAAYQTGSIYIVLNFFNPVDVDSETGFLQFPDKTKIAPFSGVFQVTTVKSIFKDGVFEQTLNLIRVPGQPIDTNQQPDADISPVVSVIDAANLPIATESAAIQVSQLDETQLANLSATDLQTADIFGNLGLSTINTNNISGIINQGVPQSLASAQRFGGNLQALTQFSSDLRLAAAGLSNFSQITAGAASVALQKISSIPQSSQIDQGLSRLDQLGVGSAELLNNLQNQQIPALSSIAVKFGSKTSTNPLTTIISQRNTTT